MSDPQSEQAEANRTGGRAGEVAKARTEGEEVPMTFCILCRAIRGIDRRAAPVAEVVPRCVSCRNPPMRVEIDVTLDPGSESADLMMRYGTRLSRQASALTP